ncbi:hypothetical protein BDW66DRAFT_136978 [Aspergillus desertorum]
MKKGRRGEDRKRKHLTVPTIPQDCLPHSVHEVVFRSETLHQRRSKFCYIQDRLTSVDTSGTVLEDHFLSIYFSFLACFFPLSPLLVRVVSIFMPRFFSQAKPLLSSVCHREGQDLLLTFIFSYLSFSVFPSPG